MTLSVRQFCTLMTALRKAVDQEDSFAMEYSNILNLDDFLFANHLLPNSSDFVDLIENLIEDREDWIGHYCYECYCDYSKMKIFSDDQITEDNPEGEWTIDNDVDFYNFLLSCGY